MATTFSDIDLAFIPHPVTGDIVPLKESVAVKKSIVNLVQTAFYERKFKHNIGSAVGRLLFEPSTPFLATNISRSISQVIENYEPRVELDSVDVNVDDDSNSVYVLVVFRITGTMTPITVPITLKRTR